VNGGEDKLIKNNKSKWYIKYNNTFHRVRQPWLFRGEPLYKWNGRDYEEVPRRENINKA
jgi:hypothetical protein